MNDTAFIPISVATLLPTQVVGLNLYQSVSKTDDEFKLYRGSEYPLSMDGLERLKSRGVNRLFIQKEAQASYQKYLRKLASGTASDGAPLSARTAAMNEVVRDVLGNSLSKGDVDNTVDSAEKLSKLAADVITNDDFAAEDLFNVMHHDYGTFTHSANVAMYCGMLAAELGYNDEEVQQITSGGLLHDLGKVEIKEDILCKPGKLDDGEFRRIQMHPTLGFRKLAHRTDINEGQLMMTYQHHERVNGKGYPVGCLGDEIHPWAKLCSVVDVFEALTSQRPYRSPMPHSKALEILQRDSGQAFEPEIVECWTKIIQRTMPS